MRFDSADPLAFRPLPSSTLGWLPYAWLIYLSGFFVFPILQGASLTEWIATTGATIVFLLSYFAGYWVHGRKLIAVIGVQVALGLAFSPVNAGAATFFVYAASFAGKLERRRDAWRLILCITLVGVATAWGLSAPAYLWIFVVVLTPLVGALNWHSMQVDRASAKLKTANDEIERLATVAERERIARDLHDVLGHTLTLIVLKAELASRLADRDPKRAAQEIREVEQVSRQALGEVRDAIAGYRASWDEELARARAMLETAGVRGEFSGSPAPVARATEEMLALAMREAITNVVRHARATVCSVRVERRGDAFIRLEVADDGRGGELTQGNGLRGLRERVEALGGSVAWQGARGTRLAVTVPATRS
jgi:two-component system, NarL family, sensor histidine kinase DesK